MKKEEPSNWGDLIRSCEKERRQLSWDPKEVAPIHRVKHYEVSQRKEILKIGRNL